MARTGGRQKSEGRVKLEELAKDELMKLFVKNKMKDIAIKFNTDVSVVSKVVNRRLFGSQGLRKDEKLQYIEDTIGVVPSYESDGAWMLSKERAYFQENKEMIMRKVNNN